MDDRKIYLIRHGAIALPDRGTGRPLIGQTDPPLSSRGREQIRQTAKWLRSQEVCHIFSSPLKRCMESAAIIARRIAIEDIHKIDRLKEIHLGLWENMTKEEIDRRFPGEYQRRGEDMAHYRPPDGESFADLQQRALLALKEINTALAQKNTKGGIAVIAHAGVNRTLLAHILDMPLGKIFALQQDYGAVHILLAGKNGCRIDAMNFRPAP